MSKLVNKVAVITGGASGIGRSTVLEFIKEGAKVVIVDINEEKGTELETEINNKGGDALFVRTDITNPDAVTSLFKKTVEKYGKVRCFS